MILKLDQMEETRFEHFKGGEGALYARMYSDDMNRIMRGRLPKGSTIGMHTHEGSSETVFVLRGAAKFTIDGKTELVPAGQAHHCPPGHTHMLENGGEEDVEFYAVVPVQ